MPPITKTPRATDETDIREEAKLWMNQQPDLLMFRNGIVIGRFAKVLRGGKYGETRFLYGGLGVSSSDLVGLMAPAGRLIALEAKIPGEEPTAEQEEWLVRIRLYGGFGGWFDSMASVVACVERARAGADR